MGCTSSRYEQRNQDLDDFSQIDVQAIGGEGRPLDEDLCPVDRLFLNYNVSISGLRDGGAKEAEEIFQIGKQSEIKEPYEDLARRHLKEIIKFLEDLKRYVEQEKREARDHKKILIGKKYTTAEVINQLNIIISKLNQYIEESPTAAQILDLDNISGMRTETIKGDIFAWRKLPLFLIKLSIENRYLFDFIKYETMRAEIDATILEQYQWILWEGKNTPPNIRKLGCLSGMITECVNKGSIRMGLPISDPENDQSKHEDNDWAISPQEVYMVGRLSDSNLSSLKEIIERPSRRDKKIVFPGLSFVYLNQDDAYHFYKTEHKSREELNNVCFKIQMDIDVGKLSYVKQQKDEKYYGNLYSCFNLEKLMESQFYKDTALINRLFVQMDLYYQEKDPVTGKKVHIFEVDQIHGKYDLICDWQYKQWTGKEPVWS